MAYNKTKWVANETPLSATNLNKIEDGIESVDKKVDDASTELETKINEVDTELSTKIEEVNTELDTKITEVDTKITEVNVEVEAQINESISEVENKLTSNINTLDEKVSVDIDSLNTHIDQVHTDLYNSSETGGEYVQNTSSISSGNSYSVNTFEDLNNPIRGIGHIIGKPKNIYRLSHRFKLIANYTLTKYRIEILEFPDTVTQTDITKGFSPSFNEWKKIRDEIHEFSEPLVSDIDSAFITQTYDLQEPILNNNKWLFVFFSYDNPIYTREWYYKVNDNGGIPFNPGYGIKRYTKGLDISEEENFVLVSQPEIDFTYYMWHPNGITYDKTPIVTTYELSPKEGYKFYTLVDKAIEENKITNKIQTIYSDIYDETKITNSFSLVCDTIINEPSKIETHSSSIFSGWGTLLGNPSDFNKISITIFVRRDHPITKMKIAIGEMPTTVSQNTNYNYYSPTPFELTQTIYDSIEVFEEPLVYTGNYITIEHILTTPIINNTKWLTLLIKFDNYVTMQIAYCDYTNTGLPYNPFYVYASDSTAEIGNNLCSFVSRSSILNLYDLSAVPVMYAKVYTPEEQYSVYNINTKQDGNFYSLVNDVLEEQQIADKVNSTDKVLNTLFDQELYPGYTGKGSADITEIDTESCSRSSLSSVFTGVMWGIGHIPETFPIEGVRLGVRARSYNNSTEPATKIYVYLCTTNSIPYYANNPTTSSIGTQIVKTIELDINVPINETQFIDVWFDEPFYNTNNKFLMLGYNLNTYCNKVYYGNNSWDASIANDGMPELYTQTDERLNVYYLTTTSLVTSVSSFSNRWADENNAYCFITKKYRPVTGEKLNTIIKDVVDNSITNIQDILVPECEVRLAKQYDVVVGDTFQLFYQGVIKAFGINNLGINTICAKGSNYTRYFQYKPTAEDAGQTYKLTIQTRRIDGSIISSGETNIVVHSVPTTMTTNKTLNILGFGDSLTSGGQWFAEGLRRIVGSSTATYSGPAPAPIKDGTLSINTYGRKTNTVNSFTINYEGYGGWTWASFLATTGGSSTVNGIFVNVSDTITWELSNVQHSVWVDNNNKNWVLEDFQSDTQIKFNRGENNNSSQNTTTLPTTLTCSSLGYTITPTSVTWESGNPFYDDETGTISFLKHAQEHGITNGPDIAACLLTWNGGGSTPTMNYQSKIDLHMSYATTLLRRLHTECPSCKIICLGIQLPSITGGMGANYGATGEYSDHWGSLCYAFDYNKALEELVTNEEFKEYCYYVDTKGQFDTENMMPHTQKAVNTRSTITEKYGTNGVHPSVDGYYQIGDAFYRKLIAILNELAQ